jgi:uncharacterized membrane protein YhaH (DUF805 family)
MRPLAAYLIFVTAFMLSSFTLFAVIIVMLGALGQGRMLANPIAATIFLFVVFVPAFAIARRQIRKPPRPPITP